MVNVPVIARRELNACFLSPTAYVVLTAFALAQGVLFALILHPPIDPGWMVQKLFTLPVYLLTVAAPVLTMQLVAEEARTGTLEALMTVPVTEAEVILGKFIGVLCFATALLLPVLAQTVFLATQAPVDVGMMLAAAMGLFLLTAQYLAVGILCSALVRTQIAAAMLSFVVLLVLCFAGVLAGGEPGPAGQVLAYLSPPAHFAYFPRGFVDSRQLAYFVITTIVFLFLAVQAMKVRRWR